MAVNFPVNGNSSSGSGAVDSVNARTGDVILDKSDVGLDSVDNTADADKPISAPTQNALDGKSDTGHTHPAATDTDAGFMSVAQVNKLAGIADNANNYTHPANHPPSIITQDASNRFVSDTEKTTWNAKVGTGDARLSDAREWTEATVGQAEAEGGTATTRRAWTAERVRQAIAAWWSGIVGTVVQQTDIGTAPNEIPLNQYLGGMAFQSPQSVVIKPAAIAAPQQVGAMVFQLTNDTTLLVKVKGSDGTVRSATLPLA